MLSLPYTQPFGRVNYPIPELNATPYQLFILQSRLFPEIYERFPYAEPSFILYPDGEQMRLFIELKEYDFPIAITDRQLESLQQFTDTIFQEYPNHCLLNYRSQQSCHIRQCRRQLDQLDQNYSINLQEQFEQIEKVYRPVIWNNQLLIDLSKTGEDYEIVYAELVNRIFNVNIGRIQLLSSLMGPTGNQTAYPIPLETFPEQSQLDSNPFVLSPNLTI